MKTIKIDEQGDFILYREVSPWKIYATSHGYYRNIRTGENCGQEVELYECDEDCYELVLEDVDVE